MVKRTQSNSSAIFKRLSVFDHFVLLALEGLSLYAKFCKI